MPLRRLILLVSAVVLVDTLFYAVVVPLLPHYAADLHLSKAGAGLLTAAYPAGTLLGALPSGVLVARVGAKQTVLVGLGLLAVSSLTFGLGHDVTLLDAARFVQGVGGACSWSGALAWLIADAPADRRGALIGTALGAAIGGELLGPVVGAIAVATAPEAVFGSVVVIAGALAAWAIATPSEHRATSQGLAAVGAAARRPAVALGMWLVALPALAFGALSVIGPLRLVHLGAGSAGVAAAFLVAAAAEAAVSPAVGRLSDRRGRLVPIRVGLMAAAAVLLVVTVPRSAVLLGATIVASAAALGAFWAPAMALLSDAAAGEGLDQGLAFSLVNLAWAVGQVTGAGAGGALAKLTGDAVPLIVASVLCLVTLGLLARRAPVLAVP